MGNLVLIVALTFFNGYNKKIEKVLSLAKSMTSSSKYTWTNVGPEGGYFVKVAVDPQDSNLAILQGIVNWVTRDGSTWQVLRDGGLDSYITFTGYHRLLFGIRDTLYYSSDGASTFVPIKTTGTVRAMTRRASDTVYLVQDSSGVSYLYKTVDGGLNWTRITPLSYASYKYITYAPSNPNVIYMAVNTTFNSDSVYIVRSSDGGITWSISSFIGNGVDVTDIEVNPQNPAESFLSCGFDGDFGLLYTTDSFLNITNVPGILIPYDVEFISSDTILVASVIPTGIMMGIRGTTDWEFEPVDTLTTCTDIERSGNVFYVSAMTGVLKSQDGGLSFTPSESGLHGTFTYSSKYLSEMINRTVYMPSIQGNAVYITRNGGVSWEKKYIPNVAVIFDVEANPQDENIVYIACGAGTQDNTGNLLLFNILYSDNGGESFTPLDTFTGNPDNYNWIESIHTFSDSANVVLGMTMVYSNGNDRDTMKVVKSIDGGYTFNDTTGVFLEPFYEDFVGDNPVFVQSDSVIYVSYDYGSSFDTLKLLNTDALQNLVYYGGDSLLFYNTYFIADSVYTLKVPTQTESSYFVPGIYLFYSARNGGFYAMSSGQNFTFYSGTFLEPFDSVTDIDILAGAIRASENEVLLFSYGLGVFRSTDAVTFLDERRTNENDKYFLLNGDVFTLSHASYNGVVKVYSITGRLVREFLIKGKNHLDFKGLSPGIYFVEFENDSKGLTKVIKIK